MYAGYEFFNFLLVSTQRDTTMERLFADANPNFMDNSDIRSAQTYHSDGCSERDEDHKFKNYVDTDWSRHFETATDYLHTTIFGTTCNQLHSKLLNMASQIGPDMSGTHRKAVVIQVASNRDSGITVTQMYKGMTNKDVYWYCKPHLQNTCTADTLFNFSS